MIIFNTVTDFSIELIEGLRSKALNIVIALIIIELSDHIGWGANCIDVVVAVFKFLFLLFCSYSIFLNVK